MPVYFFLVVNMVVMHAIGHADRMELVSIADPSAPIASWHVIFVSIMMGLLSGSIIREQFDFSKNAIVCAVWVGLHTLSLFVPFIIGLGSFEPRALTLGIGSVFALCSILTLMLLSLPKGKRRAVGHY